MGWFDEQIRQRMQHDDDNFADAFAAMASVVMGEKISRTLNDDRIQAKTAIDAILKYYHVKPVELPDSIKDVNEQLEYLMRPAGIMRRVVHLEGTWYKDCVGALLGSLKEDGTPVALLPNGFSGYHFFDNKKGKWVRVNKKNAKMIDLEAFCFYKPLPLEKIGVKDLLLYILRCMSVADLMLIGGVTLAVSLLGLLTPKIQNLIYGVVIESKSVRLLGAVFGFLICVTISQLLIGGAKQLIMSRLESKVNTQVEAAGMMRVLSLPAKFFKEYSSGELSNRLNYIKSVCMMLESTILTTGLTSLFSLVYITQMVSFGPGLVIPGLVVILCTVVFSVIVTLAEIYYSKQEMKLEAKQAGLEYSLLTGVQKIRLAGAEKRAFAKWAYTYTEQAKFQYDDPVFLRLSNVLCTSISLIGTIVIYFFTIKTQVSLADYYAFNSAYGMVMGAFSSLVGMAGSVAQIQPMLDMIRPILETAPEISKNKKVVTRLSGGIELNNVSFRYTETGPLIIDDMTLKIRPGQYVAIVGTTGCGKSTLMRLMLGFETPQKGAVYYDGKDLASLDLKSLRRNIGTVMQNGKLFQGNIYSNIVISAPRLSMDEAWEAAEMAGIAQDIRDMPMGMHTVISEGSGGISGGQRQRLMIARAIAPKPRILMFDEATSALDNITQKIVSDSLGRLKCTRIVIAHRLSTIRECDRIIVLDKGKIIEDGTYEQLIGQKGFFAQLVKRQQLETETDEQDL